MRRRLFALGALLILVAQLLVLSGSLAVNQGASISRINSGVLAQDFGTRLDPDEHTHHVAILIDQESDFTSQGWPGDGSEGNPYVISALNITYDIGLPLIRVYNIDSYFVVEDCYINQLSTIEYAVHLENVTHAGFRFVTINSNDGGILGLNADGTIIQNVLIETDSQYGLYINHSWNLEIDETLVNTTSSSGAYLNDTSYSTITDSIFDSGEFYSDVSMFYSNNVTLTSNEFHASAIDLYAFRCVNFHVNGIVSTEAVLGIYLNYCNNTIIQNANVTSDSEALYMYGCRGVDVSNSYFSSPTYSSQSLAVILCDGIFFDETHVNDTLGNGLYSYESNISILDSTFSYIGNVGILLDHSNDTMIVSSIFENILDDAISLSYSHRVSINANTMDHVARAVLLQYSDNGTVYLNEMSNANAGIVAYDCDGWEFQYNTIYNVLDGISIVFGSFIDVWSNEIRNASRYGLYADTHGMFEAWENNMTACAEDAFYFVGCDNLYIRDNMMSDCETGMYFGGTIDSTINTNIISNCYDGMYLDDVTTTEFNGNNISQCEYAGIDFYDVVYSSFIDNNLIECGFLLFIEPVSIQVYNHTFSGNTVNGKPLYYALNKTGQTLDGGDYGQIIIVNCSDIVISEGDFIHATCGIQVMFSYNVEVTQVTYSEQVMGAFALVCENVTMKDSTVSGREFQFGIFIYETMGIWIENFNFTGIETYLFDVPSAIFVPYFYNLTIEDCHFTDLGGMAITMGSGGFGVINDCTAVNVTAGIYSEGVNSMNVTNNDFMWCEVGIYAETSDDWRVTWNYLHDGETGIFRGGSNDWYTANNTILWNYVGMEYLELMTVGITADNILAGNIIANGMDNTFEYWDDGVDTGNLWGDYIGTGTYTISGVGGAIDRYPSKWIVTEPIISTPMDIWYAEGSTGNEILWLVYDNSLKNWEVEIDGEFWVGESWNFKNITVNVDGLPYGTHTAVVTVWDVDLNSVTDTVLIHVYDDLAPEIDGPPDQWLFVDATGQTIEWEVSDKNPDTYILYVDDEEFTTGTWENGTLAINVDDIGEGEHTLLLSIFDVDENHVNDTVLVLVINDDTDPTIEDAEDVVYTVGTTGNEIVWDAEDEYPASFEISFNGSVIAEGGWGGAMIIFDVDGLAVGTYEYSITVYDMSGNSASNSANVTVLPVVAPEEPLEIDWVLVIIIGAVAGGVIIAIVVVYYLRKKQN